MPGIVTTPTPPDGLRSSLTAIAPSARTTNGSNAACKRLPAGTSIVAPGAIAPAASTVRPDGETASALKCTVEVEVLVRASEFGDAPVTAGLAVVPGGGTTHTCPDGAWLSPSTASATPLCAAGADADRTTVRPTTTPGPPAASI